MHRRPSPRAWGTALFVGGVVVVALLPLTQAGAGEQTVTMRGLSFIPEELTVAVGDTVTWVNEDTDHHDTEGDGNNIDSPEMVQGDKYSFTFHAPGRFEYHCRIHTYMRGTVTVGDGNAGEPPPATEPPATTATTAPTTTTSKPPSGPGGLPLPVGVG